MAHIRQSIRDNAVTAITLQVYSHVLEGMDDAAAGTTDKIMNAILYG